MREQSSSGMSSTNYRTFRMRGWCRVEFMGAWLSPSPTLCLRALASETKPCFSWPADSVAMPPGLGDFTCCACNHVIAGQTVECDKPKIRQVLDRMCDAKVSSLLREGNIAEARYFLCAKHIFLTGLPDLGRHSRPASPGVSAQGGHPTSDSDALAAFKAKLQWKDGLDEDDASRTGWTLLLWATLDDNVRAVRGRSAASLCIVLPVL